MINPHTPLPRPSNPAPILHGGPGQYKHMDVQIVHGALKDNFRTIINMHWSKRNVSNSRAGGNSNEYEEIAVVQMEM